MWFEPGQAGAERTLSSLAQANSPDARLTCPTPSPVPHPHLSHTLHRFPEVQRCPQPAHTMAPTPAVRGGCQPPPQTAEPEVGLFPTCCFVNTVPVVFSSGEGRGHVPSWGSPWQVSAGSARGQWDT